jgi:hypothetical protein
MAIVKNVIAKIANAKIANANNKLSFLDRLIWSATWMKKINSKKIYKKVKNNLPFEEAKQDVNIFVRKFSENTEEEEFVWHRDNEDRVVYPIHETDWKFQRDNKLPEPILGEIKIKAGEWHRVIKGTGDLELKIIKN